MQKRLAAYQDVSVDVIIGGQLLEEAAAVRGAGRREARSASPRDVLDERRDITDRIRLVMGDDIDALAARYPDLDTPPATTASWRSGRAGARRFSAWYELFPRSAATSPAGTARSRMSSAASTTSRNSASTRSTCRPSTRSAAPEAQGAQQPRDGGARRRRQPVGDRQPRRAATPRSTRTSARSRTSAPGGDARASRGIEVALDIAFQVAPDHPWVRSIPTGSAQRPDGTIQYAENPPKKYQDIYPFDFETERLARSVDGAGAVFEFWIEQGVRTSAWTTRTPSRSASGNGASSGSARSIRTWIFLAEAFTTPRRMERLAKLGFTQSYTYFAWRDTRRPELTEYMHELTTTDLAEYFRPNFWPNTPDILTEYLQTGGRPAFMNRVVLAATLSSSYGIYGPRSS
jgi:starch synthase (maltosyl-transferring)